MVPEIHKTNTIRFIKRLESFSKLCWGGGLTTLDMLKEGGTRVKESKHGCDFGIEMVASRALQK